MVPRNGLPVDTPCRCFVELAPYTLIHGGSVLMTWIVLGTKAFKSALVLVILHPALLLQLAIRGDSFLLVPNP